MAASVPSTCPTKWQQSFASALEQITKGNTAPSKDERNQVRTSAESFGAEQDGLKVRSDSVA